MATASLRSRFQEHLNCAICFEQLQDPRVLPCLHSYCYECIARLDMTDNVLTCPECRTTLEVPSPPDVSFLPSNFFAKNLLDTLLAEESNSGNIVCENCDDGEHPKTRCQQCKRSLCQFCTDSHRRSRDTKSHTLSTLDVSTESNVSVIPETIRCLKHEEETIAELYCKTCKERICRDCAIADHRQHDYDFAREETQEMEEKEEELMPLRGEIKQERRELSKNPTELKKIIAIMIIIIIVLLIKWRA